MTKRKKKAKPVRQPELFPEPSERCNENWHCIICGATRYALKPLRGGGPHHVRCHVCQMRYALSLPAPGKRTRYVPKPFVNGEWQRVWRRAWEYFEKPSDITDFMKPFKSGSEAGNAMNRLDGGILKRGR